MTEVPVKFRPVGFFEASAKAKIWQFDMSWRVQQKVIRLDVSVDEPQLVDVIDG